MRWFEGLPLGRVGSRASVRLLLPTGIVVYIGWDSCLEARTGVPGRTRHRARPSRCVLGPSGAGEGCEGVDVDRALLPLPLGRPHHRLLMW